MKEMRLDNQWKPGRARAQQGRTAALLGGLILALTLPDTCLKAQVIGISKAVLLSWPEPTQEQIVVGADSPTGPVWTPWPEPIFKRLGQVCMAVPTTASQQFFKLVPGRQFVDDFSDTRLPYTNRGPWRLTWNQPGSEFLVTNGVLRLIWHGTNSGAFLAQPPGPDIVVNNFYMSVDVLDWVTSGTNWSAIGLVARGNVPGGYAYGAGLWLQRLGTSVSVTPFLSCGADQRDGMPFDIGEIPPPYRLEYSGIGTRFSLRLVNLTMQQLIREMSETFYGSTEGIVGLWINAPAGLLESHSITADNFFVSGTKP
jgi:hypothetical protein